MRIGCLQFAPQVGDVDNNLNRADAVLQRANIDGLDLLVLPELAFTGYNFKSLHQISPYLEPSGSGISSLWARTIALKYNCNVVLGYPEKVDVSLKWPTGPEFYNSAIVVNGEGETIANYHKSFLYQIDQTWALESPEGFFEKYIPGLENTTIGISMDINPYKFEAPWEDFEFASHILEARSNLIIVSMAWMTTEEYRQFSRKPDEPDMDALAYWVSRLEPIIRAETKEEIIVVFCNRTGTEGNITYSGTSAVIGIQDGEVKVYGLLGRGSKELLVVNTDAVPYAKLVHRPSPSSDGPQRSLDEAAGNILYQRQSDLRLSHSAAPPPPDSIPLRLRSSNLSPFLVHDSALAKSDQAIIPEPEPAASRLILPSGEAGKWPKVIIPQSGSRSAQGSCEYSAKGKNSEACQEADHRTHPLLSAPPGKTSKQNPRPPEDSTPYPYSHDSLDNHTARWDAQLKTVQARIDDAINVNGQVVNSKGSSHSVDNWTAAPTRPKSRRPSRSRSHARSMSMDRESNNTISNGQDCERSKAALTQRQDVLFSQQVALKPNNPDILLQTVTGRGRAPKRFSALDVPERVGKPKRSTSADSTRNDILHRRDRNRDQSNFVRRSSSQPKF